MRNDRPLLIRYGAANVSVNNDVLLPRAAKRMVCNLDSPVNHFRMRPHITAHDDRHSRFLCQVLHSIPPRCRDYPAIGWRPVLPSTTAKAEPPMIRAPPSHNQNINVLALTAILALPSGAGPP